MAIDDEIRGAAVPHMSYALIVAGLDVRYTSHAGWPAAALPIEAGNYTDRAAVIGVSPLAGRIDVAAGIAEYDTITISLATGGPNATTETDPGLVLGRVGYRDATDYARLITSIDQALASPATIEVDRDVSGWTFPAIVHIGAESFAVTGAAGIGTAGDPYRFTGAGRRRRGTAAAHHNADGLQRPWVVSEPVFWRWRRAVLYARPVRPDGSFGDLIEVMRGFVDGAPAMSGASVSVALLPLTAVLDRKISGADAAVRLIADHHYFEGSAATTLQHAQAPGTELYSELITAGSLAGSGVMNVPTQAYANSFDLSLADEHARHGLIAVVGAAAGPVAPPEAPIAIGGAAFLTVPGPVGALTAGDRAVSVAMLPDLITLDLIDPEPDTVSLEQWPGAALAALTAWAPGVHTGAAGAWVDVTVDDAQAALVFDQNIERAGHFVLEFWGDGRGGAGGVIWDIDDLVFVGSPRLLWYPIDFRSPDDDTARGGAWTREIDIRRRRSTLPIRGVCRGGWYQSGERYILADGPLSGTPTRPLSVEITYHDRDIGETATQTARIIGSTALATGYALEVSAADRDRLSSFGDWGDGEPVTIRPHSRIWASTAWRALLTALHSGGGQLATDPIWDLEYFGGALLTEDVDQDSFKTTPSSPGLDFWSPLLERGAALRDAIEPILQSTSSALVMRRDAQGRCRLTRVSVGLESAIGATAAIGADDWAAEPPPSTQPDRQIINRYKLTTNHAGGGGGDGQITVNFEDAASIAANGDGETLEVELRGLYLDGSDPAEAAALFRDLVARWSEMAGYERKGWRGSIGIGKAWRIGLGSTVVVSSPLLRGDGGAFGVTAEAARVVDYRIPLWPGDGDAADLRVISHGVRGSGWAPALLAATRVDATTVTITANAYAPAEHMTTGAALVDLDFFSEGDAVIVRQRYDQDTYVTTTIATIDRAASEVKLAVAHNLTVAAGMGTIEPATYDNQSTAAQPAGYTHKELASIADSAGKLGAGNDDGFTLL